LLNVVKDEPDDVPMALSRRVGTETLATYKSTESAMALLRVLTQVFPTPLSPPSSPTEVAICHSKRTGIVVIGMGDVFIGTVCGKACPAEAPYTPMLPECVEPTEYAARLLTTISSWVLGLLGWCT